MSRSRQICAIGFSPRNTSITVSNLNSAVNCRCFLRVMFFLHRLPLYPFSRLCPKIRPHYRVFKSQHRLSKAILVQDLYLFLYATPLLTRLSATRFSSRLYPGKIRAAHLSSSAWARIEFSHLTAYS